jgi:4-aminobutyrate aminotransferase-like enzyme/Ser/Thr protein kinase RdoA (MazF antagonist)
VSAPTSPAASVLEAPPPRFSAGEASTIAVELFGLHGRATALGSERDQTFAIDDGGAGGVLKISNLGEDAAVLDLEAQAILHIRRVDPALPVAAPHATLGGGYHATVDGSDGRHFVRLFDRVHGRTGGPELAEDAVFDYAATHARLNLALRTFFHPSARRDLLWNLEHAPKLRALIPSIADAERRRLVAAVLDRFDERVVPRWPHLRAHVVHGDLNLDNVVLDERDRIAGIFDFGDTAHSAQSGDFAVGLASLLRGRDGDDVFRTARIAIDGYASRIPFEPLELEVVAHLVTARLATIVTVSAWRVERYPENAEYIQAWDADSWELLELFDATGAEAVAVALGAPRRRVSTAALATRRREALGSALTAPTYRRPVHVVRGEGVWLFEADGTELLDAYNNVPVVGHCHPRVTEAVVRQTRLLNTHARYLYEPLIELAERLAASMPADSDLDTVMLVNSGSEANDIAWRIATTVTGSSGAIVTEHAYHGVTHTVADFSPEEWPRGFSPANVETIPPPGTDAASDAERAVERLRGRGVGLAATYVDGGFTSDGIRTPQREEVRALVDATRAAGGLFVADEVQAGHGRTGEHLWSFAGYGIAPDLVTLGKPMGNGYPVAAVIARRELVDRFAAVTSFFSTFGGNPVAASAALAVLDVIEDERLVANAARVGAHLREALADVGRGHDAVAAVRGRGLLVGVELVSAGGPDPDLAGDVVNRLRDDGILIGRTGRDDNVLKIRPPLVFREEHADRVAAAVARALAAARPRPEKGS